MFYTFKQSVFSAACHNRRKRKLTILLSAAIALSASLLQAQEGIIAFAETGDSARLQGNTTNLAFGTAVPSDYSSPPNAAGAFLKTGYDRYALVKKDYGTINLKVGDAATVSLTFANINNAAATANIGTSVGIMDAAGNVAAYNANSLRVGFVNSGTAARTGRLMYSVSGAPGYIDFTGKDAGKNITLESGKWYKLTAIFQKTATANTWTVTAKLLNITDNTVTDQITQDEIIHTGTYKANSLSPGINLSRSSAAYSENLTWSPNTAGAPTAPPAAISPKPANASTEIPAAVNPALSGGHPFPRISSQDGGKVYETTGQIGLYNSKTGVIFDKKQFQMQGLWLENSNNLARNSSVWQVILAAGNDKKQEITLQPSDAESITYKQSVDAENAGITVTFNNVSKDKYACDVIVNLMLGHNSDLVKWKISVKVLKGKASVWNVSFPVIAANCMTPDPTDTQLVYPYRQGKVSPMKNDGRMIMPYPGAAVKFQFMAVYNQKNGDGVYLGVEDPNGYNKGFYQRGMPKSLMAYMGIEHYPENRGVDGQDFVMPYYVTVSGFKGDWWNAARIYREWWVNQQWASKGPMLSRKDVPDWLKNAVMSIKLSSCPPRSVSENLKNALEIGKAFNNQPVLGIWYHFENKKKTMDGHGFSIPPQQGVEDALKQMLAGNIHVLAYVQSLIYDQDFDKDDVAEAKKYYALELNGKPYEYNAGEGFDIKINMCRSTGWWHQRILKISDDALKLGFEGIYLDSFGKSSSECFDPSHGHALGGGNYGIQGQRTMAELVRQLIKKESPSNVMSGEAPVEAFTDKLDYYLFAVNVMPDYAPIWRTVFGDYMIGHGRGLAQSKQNDNVPAECGRLFVDGTILGRIFCSGKSFIFNPANSEQLEYIRQLLDYTTAGLDYLRLGEYMHPAALSPEPPTLQYHEYAKNSPINSPSILNSVTRSHRDGSVAYVFVNIGKNNYAGEFEADAALCKPARKTAQIFRMARDGKLQRLVESGAKAKIKLELKPLEVGFFVVK